MSLRHRPWEAGSDFAIGLRPIPEDHWLEGGETDPSSRKDPLFNSQQPLVWGETPGSLAGQCEVAGLIGGPGDDRFPPLYSAARQIADDLVIMSNSDGAWRVVALSLSAPSFFAANQVIGRSLAEIHAPVHGFQDRFLTRLTRIFDHLRPGHILERRNWSVVSSPDLFTPSAVPQRAAIKDIVPGEVGARLHTRVERQTIRKLPQTGCIIFTIRVWLTPLSEIASQPETLARFARGWRAATADFAAYKGFSLYEALVDGFLRAQGESYSVNAN